MKVTRNPNGSILLEPETDDEKEGLQYEYDRRGTSYLKEMLEKHVTQRKEQKRYEETMEIASELEGLTDTDRRDVIQKAKLEARKKTKRNG